MCLQEPQKSEGRRDGRCSKGRTAAGYFRVWNCLNRVFVSGEKIRIRCMFFQFPTSVFIQLKDYSGAGHSGINGILGGLALLVQKGTGQMKKRDINYGCMSIKVQSRIELDAAARQSCSSSSTRGTATLASFLVG